MLPQHARPKRAHEALRRPNVSIYTRGNTYYVDVRDGTRPAAPQARRSLQGNGSDGGEGPAGQDRPGGVPGDLRGRQHLLLRVRGKLAGEEEGDRFRVHIRGLRVHHEGVRPPPLREDPAVPGHPPGRGGFPGRLRTLSAKRKNNIMVPVKCLFNDAKRRGDIKGNPTELIRRFKEEKPQIDPFSFPEMKAFLAQRRPALRPLLHHGVLDRDAAQRDAGAEMAPRRLRHALRHDPRGARAGDRGTAQDAVLVPGHRHARPAVSPCCGSTG